MDWHSFHDYGACCCTHRNRYGEKQKPKNRDFHLCLKTENGYVCSPLRYIGELSTCTSFVDISDPEIFHYPEKAKIVTAAE